MKKKVVKVLVWIFQLSLFCGYFYILFVNLVCGLSYGGITSRGQAIKILIVSFVLAVTLPGLIWYQHRRILKLEKRLDECTAICKKQNSRNREAY